MMLAFQTSCLTAFGFIPTSHSAIAYKTFREKCISYVLTGVGLCLLIGTAGSCTLLGTIFLYSVAHPEDHPTPLALRVMQQIPYLMINCRAFIICLIAFRKRQAWHDLLQDASEFLVFAFPISASCNGKVIRDGPYFVKRRLRKASIVLGLLAIGLHLLWEYGEWGIFLDGTYHDVTFYSDNAADPLPITFYIYQYIVTWTLFSTLPFLLSQQVLLNCIVLGLALQEAVTKLLAEIHAEIRCAENGFLRLDGPEMALLAARVDHWETFHLTMLLFCRRVVKFFSAILFLTFSLDLLTSVGFASIIVKNYRSDVGSYGYLFGSVLIFSTYVTVFVFPLVYVREKSENISFALHRLESSITNNIRKCRVFASGDIDAHQPNNNGSQFEDSPLLKSLRRLKTDTKRHICMFHGLELVHYNREVIAGVKTVREMIKVNREFFVKEETHALVWNKLDTTPQPQLNFTFANSSHHH